MGLFKPLGNGDLLGALFLTFQAFNTIIRPGLPGFLAIAESGGPWVVVHEGVIIVLKGMGNIDTVRTGQTVFTTGAGDGAQFPIIVSHLIYER